ncbi:MAG: ATP-dependent DNA helicase [Candidatus Nanoarchaeia archaeon]
MKNMYFPFQTIRPIQKELTLDMLYAIKNKKHLIAHAPTGLGKTAASLSAALTEGLDKGYSIFFLTPKHTQHAIAIETLQKIKEKHNLDFEACDLIGKRWMCSHTAIDSLNSKEFHNFCKALVAEEQCPFYNNVWGKGKEKLQPAAELTLKKFKNKILHAEEFVDEVKDAFCPYELAVLKGRAATVIIADYYHLFHPSIRLTLLSKLKKELKNSIIIIDEAHNLPIRIRNILSERISQANIKRALKEAKALHLEDTSSILKRLDDALENLAKKYLGNLTEVRIKKEYFIQEFESFGGISFVDAADELQTIGVEIRRKEKKSYIGSIGDFLDNWLAQTGPEFVQILKRKYFKSNSYISISNVCLNPAIAAKEVFDSCVSAILMSGTLVPGELYRDLLSLDPLRTNIKAYPSPFKSENRLVLIEPSTTTKFTEREPKEFEKIANLCAEIISAVPHNVAIFFPSYAFLQSILSFLENKIIKKIFVDKQEFTKAQRAEILANFKRAADFGGGVLFTVSGASFAEGVDMPGKYLEAAIIVGIPLATPDLETQALIEYYEEKFKRGWDYGYIYPAMTKALQAAGRCVRSLEDRGVVVFLDKRYLWKNYLKCIPPNWKPKITKMPATHIKAFFQNLNK